MENPARLLDYWFTVKDPMRKFALCLLLAIAAGCNSTDKPVAIPAPTVPEMTPPPGKNADPASFGGRVFYEMWIRSFQDSDGDGIGDFKGAEQRLDELADMGIGGIWLMPTFPSPLADSGYDVADYKAVHPDYGTLDDLDRFVKAAHDRNILVYLDMVFNHTSDQHAWFQSALTGASSPYFNYFVWAPSPLTKCTDVIPGPFGSERWQEVDSLGLMYFHQFYPRQPDLNFENPAVQTELLNVLTYWMGRGIDGFRFDVPDRYFEEGDECTHNPKTLEFHARLRETISGLGTLDRGFVGEIWGIHDEVKPFFGPRGNPMIFAFELLFSFYSSIAVGSSPGALAVQVEEMLRDLPAESRWGIVIGNHDVPRFAEVAVGDVRKLRLAAAVQLTLPGVPFLWMGDELGLRMGKQVNIDWRDGARTPYPWAKDEPGFGFTTAKTSHLAFAPGSDVQAYDQQRADGASLLNYYRRLIAVRNAEPGLHSTAYQEIYRDDAVWVYRRGTGADAVIVAVNFSAHPAAYALSSESRTDLLTEEAVVGEFALAPGQTRILK